MKHAAMIILMLAVTQGAITAFAEDDPGDDLFIRGSSYFFQRKFDMAESLFRQAIEERPDHAQAHAYLGDILLIKKRYDDALAFYRKSVDLDPASGENYFRIGQIYYYKKDGPRAIDSFTKAIEVDGQLRFAHYHVGLAYLMLMRDKQHTIENWETYLKTAPDDPQYPRIRRAIELLRDPAFIIPPPDSDISIEEALLLGGMSIDRTMHESTDREAGHETKKTKRELEDLYLDDDL